MQKITTHLWFDEQALEAAEFYTSIFKNSKVVDVTHYGEGAPRPAGTVLTVTFELDGQRFIALNGGPEFTFTEAVSLYVECADQAEVDYYWDALVAGGEPSMCGWLKDRYSLSWQIIPKELPQLLTDPDPEKSQRAMQAMFTMNKIDLAEIRKAGQG